MSCFFVSYLFQQSTTLGGKEADLVQHHLDVLALLLEVGPTAVQLGKKLLELLAFVPGDVVQLEQLADLREREPQALAAQGELEAHRSEEHTSELQSLAYLVCRLLLEKKKINI